MIVKVTSVTKGIASSVEYDYVKGNVTTSHEVWTLHCEMEDGAKFAFCSSNWEFVKQFNNGSKWKIDLLENAPQPIVKEECDRG